MWLGSKPKERNISSDYMFERVKRNPELPVQEKFNP